MANVTEQECGDRRKDIYEKVTVIKEQVDRMEGGINVAKWMIGLIVPLMILLLGAFVKLQTDTLKQEIRHVQKDLNNKKTP